MATIVLPFQAENNAESTAEFLKSEIYQKMPDSLKEISRVHPHLLEYLQILPYSQIGIPDYFPELNRKLGDLKEPNLIYPVGNGLFTHIMVDYKDGRNNYIQIEPNIIQNVDELTQEVETKCIEYADMLPEFDMEGDRESQLTGYINKVVTLDKTVKKKSFDLLSHFPTLAAHLPVSKKKKFTKVLLSERDLSIIKYLFIRDKIGLGMLQPLIYDPYIEDISCSGMGQVFIEHKIFKALKSTLTFYSLDEIDQFVLRLAEQIKKPVTYRSPIADATLPDGSRINIVYGRDVSKRGSNFSIRKFAGVPLSVFDLVDFNTINYEMLAYLSLVVGNGMNLFVAGESASGKTSMLNALTTFINPLHKIITIEDTPELQVPHDNWIREVVQTTKANDTSGAIGMFDLLKAALRQRPNEIMVGEIRGAEGNIAFQAMQTGHTVMATFHAASMEKLIQRITSAPISVPKTYLDNLNVAVLMSTMKLPNGKMGRRITNIAELAGYDPSTESFNIVDSFQWDAETDTYDFTGYMTSYLLEHKIAGMMGLPGNKKQLVYKEIEKRARILNRLHKEQGITGFYELLEVLAKAQREGFF